MIEPTAAASSATRAATTGGTVAGTPASKTAKSFANELARSVSASDSAKPKPRPDGEQTKKIAGHPYSRIENGSDKGMFLNQLSGSERLGSVFRMVERDDHVFHVYGTGKAKLVVEVEPQSKTGATSKQTAGDSTSGTTTTTGT
jgi:hypothetical protein